MNNDKSTNDSASTTFEAIDDTLLVAECGEEIGWALAPEDTIFINKIDGQSSLAKFFNLGGIALLFLSTQFLLYCYQFYICSIEAYHSTKPEDRQLWIYRAIEDLFLASLTGLLIVSCFFALSFLMMPIIVTLSSYDLITHLVELWENHDAYTNAKSEIEQKKILDKRKQLWLQILGDTCIIIFSILGCLENPILSTIGSFGCLVGAIIPHTPNIFSWIKSHCHDDKNNSASVPENRKPAIELTHYKLPTIPEKKANIATLQAEKPWQKSIGIFAEKAGSVAVDSVTIYAPTYESNQAYRP